MSTKPALEHHDSIPEEQLGAARAVIWITLIGAHSSGLELFFGEQIPEEGRELPFLLYESSKFCAFVF